MHSGLVKTIWQHSRLSQALMTITMLVALILITVILWSPYGLKTVDTNENWILYNRLEQQGALDAVNINNRPLGGLPTVLGYALTPDSFVGLNLVEMALIVGKGFLLFLFVCLLTNNNYALAALSGILFVIYPSDSGIFTLRTINIHLGVFLFLLATYLLCIAWKNERVGTLIFATVAEMLCLLIYETPLLLLLFCPILLSFFRMKITRYRRQLLAAWYSVAIGDALLIIYFISRGGGYQFNQLRTASFEFNGSTILAMLSSLLRAYTQNLFTGWADAFYISSYHMLYPALVVIGASVIALLMVLFVIMTKQNQPIHSSVYVSLLLVSLATIGLGFIPYLPTLNRNENWRVFLYSSAGSALFIALLCYLVCKAILRRFSVLGLVVISALLVGIALDNSFHQFQYNADNGRLQLEVLARVAEKAPQIESGTSIVFLDRPPFLAQRAWIACSLLSQCFNAQMRYLYKSQDITAFVCPWQYSRGAQFVETCAFGTDGLSVSSGVGSVPIRTEVLPYSHMLVFESSSYGICLLNNLDAYAPASTTAYQPQAHIDFRAKLPVRTATVYPEWPFLPQEAGCNPASGPSDSVAIHFDQPVDGTGWRLPEGEATWSNAVDSALEIKLKTGVNYKVQFRVIKGITPAVLDSLYLSVNNVPIPLVRAIMPDGATQFEGFIMHPIVELNPSSTDFVFHVSQVLTPKSLGLSPDVTPLGVLFESLSVEHVVTDVAEF